jgi:hypothetical protein
VSGADVTAPRVARPIILPITPRERLPLIEQALQRAQVMYVELRYHGGEGSGGYTVRFYDRHKQSDRWEGIDINIREQLSGFLWQLVKERYYFWDKGPGSFGVVNWDVRADRLQHFHHQRTIDVQTSLIDGL